MKVFKIARIFVAFVHCYFSSVLFGVISLVFRTMPRTCMCPVSICWREEGRKEGKKEGQMNFTQQSLKPKTKCLRKEVSWLIYSNGLTEKACGCSSQQAFSEHILCLDTIRGMGGKRKVKKDESSLLL